MPFLGLGHYTCSFTVNIGQGGVSRDAAVITLMLNVMYFLMLLFSVLVNLLNFINTICC